MVEIYAHSLPNEPEERWELLPDHSLAVAQLAAKFATPLGWAEVLRLAGRLHDIGKMSPQFQDYIRQLRSSGGDHSTAGARIALDGCGPNAGKIIAILIAAHHAGLADGIDLVSRMDNAEKLVPGNWESLTGPLPTLADLRPSRPLPAGGPKGFANSFLIRMLFGVVEKASCA